MPSNNTNTEGLVFISDIVNSYKASKGDTTKHLFIRFLHWAIKGYRELNLSLGIELRTAAVKMDHLKRINLFALRGFRTLVKVGIVRGDRVLVFIPDSSISKIFTRTVQPINEPLTPYVDYFSTINTSDWSEMFLSNFIDVNGNYRIIRGYGNGHSGTGYFTYDRSMGQLLFSAETVDELIYVEYIKDAFEVGSKTMVPQIVAEYLENYIRWQESRQKVGDAANETQARASVLRESLMAVIMRTDSISIDSIQDIVVRGIAKMR